MSTLIKERQARRAREDTIRILRQWEIDRKVARRMYGKENAPYVPWCKFSWKDT